MLKTFPSSGDGQIQIKTDDMYKIFTDSAAVQKIDAKLIFFSISDSPYQRYGESAWEKPVHCHVPLKLKVFASLRE